MNYQPRSTNPYIMEKKLNECVGGGGLDPSVLEEIEAEISVLGSENATMAQDIIDIKGSLNSINDSYKVENGKPLWSADGGVTWENFSIGAVLLWTNSAPTASFTAQTLNLDLSNYEYLVVICKYSTNQDILPRTSTLVKIDDQRTDYTGLSATNTAGSNVSRGVKASSNSVTFTACTGGSGTYNSNIIPIYILGLKKCPISNLESYTE